MKSKALLWMLPAALGSTAAEKPNVLFIAVDDLKPILGCYGDPLVKSPNIDRLASMGTVFLNAHCQQAVCGPSRASLLTGLRPDTTKVWDLETRIRDVLPDVVTLPQYFKQNGYTAVGTGKIFDPRSVDGQVSDDPSSWSRPYVQFPKNPDEEFGCVNPEFVTKVRALGLKGVRGEGKLKKELGGTPPVELDQDVPDDAYDDGRIAKTGMALLKELAAKDTPFFVAVGFKKPHLPFVAPKKYADLYERSQFKLAEIKTLPAGAPEYAGQPGWELRTGSYSDIPLLNEGRPIPDEMQITLIHGYHACVSYTDAQIGKLLDTLESSGKASNTIIVLWGDHGWHLGDHGIWCKHTNYEQATRAPLIIADLRKPKAQKSSSPVGFLDIYPTLCDLAGLPIPGNLEGVSLTPVLKNPAVSVIEAAVSQFPRSVSKGIEAMGYSFRDTRYRYTEWIKKDYRAGQTTGETIAREFYDYEADPLEQRNLIDRPEYATEVKRLETFAADFKEKKSGKETEMKKSILIPAVSALAAVTLGQNVLLNPAFEGGGIKPWKVQGKIATQAAAADGVLQLTMTEASDIASQRMLVQQDLVMESNTKYLLQFDARTEGGNGGGIKVSVVPSKDFKAGHYGLMRDEKPGAEWKTYEYPFKTKEIKSDDPACLKIHLGLLNGNLYFKNFVLKKTE
jgi:arylsulfatase A-like enzyme